jgi:probable F420-dependent oxidoreductase
VTRIAFKLNAYGLRVDTAFGDVASLACSAEDLGFDAVYLIDHLYMPDAQLRGFSTEHAEGRPFFPDTWTLLPALAARTTSVKLGPQVSPTMRLDPVTLARAGATIDWLSGGRFRLQVGMGWNAEEYEAFGLAYDRSVDARARRLEEAIEVVRLLWTSDVPVTYMGEFFRLTEAPLWPKPMTESAPQIWVGGSGRRARQATARCGDGWTPAAPHYQGLTPDAYAAGIEEIRTTARQEYGRDPESIVAAGFFFVVTAETDASAEARAARLVQRDIWRDLTVQQLADRGIAFIGTPERVARMMRRYTDAGVQYFTVAFMPIGEHAETLSQMRLFSEVVTEFHRSEDPHRHEATVTAALTERI